MRYKTILLLVLSAWGIMACLFLDENCGQVCASAKPVNKQLSFKVGRQIEEDTLTCWVTLRLRDDAAQATSKI